MLKKLRVTLAILCFTGILLLFLDFTGTIQNYLGFLAKIQFFPALLAVNVVVVAVLVILTLIFGRLYCSVICPLGVYQDAVSHISTSRKGHKNSFKYHNEKKWPRYIVLSVFILCLIAGIHVIVSFFEPYSIFGRAVQNLLQPIYICISNLIARISAHFGSYSLYTKEVWIRSLPTFIVAAAMIILVTIHAWKNGRAYCNTICPVGTILSFFSRFAMFRPAIDRSMCVKCGKCAKNCKAECIDIETKTIDYSRCVDCFNCIGNCKRGGIHYQFAWGKNKEEAQAVQVAKPAQAAQPDKAKRAFMLGGILVAGSAITAKAQEEGKKLDGGFADILSKQAPRREKPLTPPGSESIDNFYQHCTACQLCVAECPNNVLRPSKSLDHFMQPEMSFEKGYCRPECTKCSHVCPAGAIKPITREEKTTYKLGTAVVDLSLCVPYTTGDKCGNCARHCPVGAIMLVKKDPSDKDSVRIPSVNESRCIGCGACENLCPSRPVSAITINGVDEHLRKNQ